MTNYDKQYYEANKETIYLNQRKWHKKNAERVAKRAQQYAEKNPAKILLATCKQRATKRELSFDLKESDIFFPEVCPYLGVPLTYIRGKGRQQTNFSIDRIDNSQGYLPGNIQIISDLANRMKQEATPEQLVAFAKGILSIHGDYSPNISKE